MANDDFTVPDSPEGLNPSNSFPTEEPGAGWRQSATNIRQFYVSLVQAGFSADESLELVKIVVRIAAENGMRGNNPE